MSKKSKKLKSIMILHGPGTVGGIGWSLSSWQRARGFVSENIVHDDFGMHQLYDLNLRMSSFSKLRKRMLQISFFFFALFRYDLFHFYYNRTFLPLNLDLPILRLFGKKIIMTYCGSEVRLMCVEKQRNPYADLLSLGTDKPKYDIRKKIIMWWQNMWIHRFIAVRNLYDSAIKVIPEHKITKTIWLNNLGFNSSDCFDPDVLTTRSRPVLVHAPSEKGIKGTKYVRQAIDELRNRGVEFDYREIYKVPNVEAQQIYQGCDIVIDQFIVGGIGTLAFEAFGYGKPLVSYVLQDVIDRDMPDCPVWNATIDNLADKLEYLICQPKLRLELGRKGVEFVKQHLDYENIQNEVIRLYENLW